LHAQKHLSFVDQLLSPGLNKVSNLLLLAALDGHVFECGPCRVVLAHQSVLEFFFAASNFLHEFMNILHFHAESVAKFFQFSVEAFKLTLKRGHARNVTVLLFTLGQIHVWLDFHNLDFKQFVDQLFVEFNRFVLLGQVDLVTHVFQLGGQGLH